MKKDNFMNVYNRFNVNFIKGKGTKLWDDSGKEYLDFVSGVAVNCLGHCDDSIVDTIHNQSKTLMHVSNLYYTDKQNELAKKITSMGTMGKAFFCNSGTEAVEAALKIARKYGRHIDKEKNEIVYMANSFHGRTMGALSVTGKAQYQESFKPLIGNVVEAKFNNIDSINNCINNNTCAVILEPVQGEGGIISADIKFLKEVQKLCSENNALLIFDEVQCGAGRLGSFFAYEKFNIIPDIICMAKGLGAGFPIGAVLAKGKAAEVIQPGDHGSTFGGNPLASAVALTVIEQLVDKGIIKEVNNKGEYFKKKLNELKSNYSCIGEIKGMGLLLGVEFDNSKEIIKKCLHNGLLLVGAGKNVVRFLPPLNVSYEEIDEAINILEKSL